MNASTFITLLPQEIQNKIYNDLLNTGIELTEEDLDNAMNSRLCDLSDIIDCSRYIN